MNKAKMTFRFDHDPGRRRSSERKLQEQPRSIIPLNSEEYRVVEEQAERTEGSLFHEELPAAPTKSPAAQQSGIAPSPLIDGQTLNQYTTDFGGWQSSFDIETQRVERLIRESGGATATDQRNPMVQPETGYVEMRQETGEAHGRDQTGYQPPLEPLKDHRWYVPEETAYVTRRGPGSSWLKIITSVAGAVITGVAFGFFVLSMFSDDSKGTENAVKNNVSPGQASSVAATAAASNDKSAAGANGKSATGAAAAASIPAKSYSFLQSGVFSTSQSADAAQADLKKKGFGAVSETGDKYPVYVGMALSKEEAQGLAQLFQQKQIEVMVKTVELPALSKIKWSAKPSEAFASYINQGDKLLGLIAPQAAAHLTEAKPSPLSDAALQSIKTAHQAWTGMTASATEGLAEDAQAAVQKMNSALNMAVISLDEYKKYATPSYMWQAQTALMQYVISQRELRNAVAAQ